MKRRPILRIRQLRSAVSTRRMDDVNPRRRITVLDVSLCPKRGMGDVNPRRWITVLDVSPCPTCHISDVNARRWITVFDVIKPVPKTWYR